MQGQKSIVDSFPDTFDHGSSTSNSGVNQQLLWNDMLDAVDNRLPNFLQSSVDANSVTCDGRNLSGLNLGEPRSSENRRTQITHDERRYGRTNLSLGSVNVSLNSNQVTNGPLFLQNSSSDDISRNVGLGKRKAPEEVSGQLSLGGSSSCFRAVPSRYNASSSSSISTPTDNPLTINSPQLNSQIGVSSLDSNVESSERNLRRRMNPAHQQDSAPSNPSLMHQSSSRLISFDHLLDLRPPATNTTSLSQSHITHIPGLQQNVNPFSWNEASNSRVGSSSSSVIPGVRTVSLEEVHARSLSRNISDHPMSLPAIAARNLTPDRTHWNLATNGNIGIYSNVASTSRIGSSSVVLQSAAPTWIPQHNSPIQQPQRLSEAVRRSLFTELGGPNSNFPLSRSGPAISQEMVFSPPIGHHVHHHQHYARSALWTDRQGVNGLGVPLSFRNVPSAIEGRSRLLSEIRNVLDFIRRGSGLRFEDVFILDQSILLGVRELHDRHRGMRLDVDNMTYEELLALEERIGDVSTGLNEDAILNCLKQRKYCSIGLGTPSEVEPCCICQEEYVDGEDIGALGCGHDFHTGCIKQWLMQKNVCPICKTAAFVT